MEDLKTQIYTYLTYYCNGRNKAIKAQTLAFHYEINVREINEIIRQLRKEGTLIGSAKEPPFGYYIPVTEAEEQAGSIQTADAFYRRQIRTAGIALRLKESSII